MKWVNFIVILIIIIQQTSELEQNGNKNNSVKLFKCKKKQKQNQNPQNLIVLGSDASSGQFPWHVVIDMYNPKTYCGGSILSATWVLTACHCLENHEIFQIAVGSTQLNKQTQIQNTTKVFRHPKYDTITLNYDVGLITFDVPLVMDAHVKPVALPTLTQSKKLFTGAKVTTCGFGRDYALNNPEKLQYVNLKVIQNDDCKLHFLEGEVKDETMCAVGQQHKLASVCYGDSGGGAVIQIDNVPIIIGIGSFVGGDCNLGLSGFSRVGYHIDWISKTSGIKVLP